MSVLTSDDRLGAHGHHPALGPDGVDDDGVAGGDDDGGTDYHGHGHKGHVHLPLPIL